MSTAASIPIPAANWPDERPAKISADEFFAMIEAEVFAGDRRVFLRGGSIGEKGKKTVAYVLAVYEMAGAIRSAVVPDWLIWPENPIRLDDFHAPLPDIVVVRGPLEVYEREHRHPRAGDVGLIVEVSVTSPPKDPGERAEVFARALVPNYWVADVLGRRVIEHRGPAVVEGVGRYESVRPIGLDGEVGLVLDGREVGPIPVRDLLR